MTVAAAWSYRSVQVNSNTCTSPAREAMKRHAVRERIASMSNWHSRGTMPR